MYWNTNKLVTGSIYHVSPKNLELYALRQLLITPVACKHFKDLRAKCDDNGEIILNYQGEIETHDNFFLAAKALGLIKGEEE